MDAYILVLLIIDVMGSIWLWESRQERKEEQKHCPVCNGLPSSTYRYWCHKHSNQAWSEFISRKK